MKNTLKKIGYYILKAFYLIPALIVLGFKKLPITRREKVYALLILNMVVYAYFNHQAVAAGQEFFKEFEQEPIYIDHIVEVERIVEVDKPRATVEELKLYVKTEVEKAGLDWKTVECFIPHESNWDQYAYGINTNGTTDFGLWQINSIHKNTASVECRWDYKCSTAWAINKRLTVGHWNDWVGYKKHCK